MTLAPLNVNDRIPAVRETDGKYRAEMARVVTVSGPGAYVIAYADETRETIRDSE